MTWRPLPSGRRSARKPVRIRCCTASSCLWSAAMDVKNSLQAAVLDAGLGDQIDVCEVGCMRLCSAGPLVQVDPAGPFYEHVEPAHASAIVSAATGGHAAAVPRCDPHQPFFARQTNIVLENSGIIEPGRIESYIEAGGYRALHHILREMSPAEVVDEITKSGLRGRGGAGYPTGLKWATVAKQPAGRKFVVCNADEGDPGAFMDRSIMESDPHRVLEGMAIAAYAVGADRGFIYVRGEYEHAIARLDTAIKQARSLGTLGSQIFGIAV